MRRTEGEQPEPLPAVLPPPLCHLGLHFPDRKKKSREHTRCGDGQPASGGGRRVRSPAATLIVARLQLHRVHRSGGAARPPPRATPLLARGGAAVGKPSRRPRSRGQPPEFFRPSARGGGGAAATRVPWPPPPPAEGPRASRKRGRS
eukprot:bmy_07720T0